MSGKWPSETVTAWPQKRTNKITHAQTQRRLTNVGDLSNAARNKAWLDKDVENIGRNKECINFDSLSLCTLSDEALGSYKHTHTHTHMVSRLGENVTGALLKLPSEDNYRKLDLSSNEAKILS